MKTETEVREHLIKLKIKNIQGRKLPLRSGMINGLEWVLGIEGEIKEVNNGEISNN